MQAFKGKIRRKDTPTPFFQDFSPQKKLFKKQAMTFPSTLQPTHCPPLYCPIFLRETGKLSLRICCLLRHHFLLARSNNSLYTGPVFSAPSLPKGGVCVLWFCHPKATVYSACVFSSTGSPGGSGGALVSTGRSPLRIDRRSETPRTLGKRMKSYKKPPITPPMIGPTQYT